MKILRRKGRLAIIALSGIAITVFCIEYLSYIYNSGSWPVLRKSEDVIATVLFVADPQIQGEEQESFLFGWITRWDSDRYLRKNFHLAKHHVSPDVIIFLGDLFDEGSLANDPEYRRYFKRFRTIFDLPSTRNPQIIKYVYVPGDNDVGGEKSEPVDPIKVKWFTKKFGEMRKVVDFQKSGISIQFVKMNLFMPNEYKSPLNGFEHVINGTKKPDYRFIVSHISLLSFMTNAVEQVIENFQPNLIFSAHSHKSSYLRHIARSEKRMVHIIHDFLLPGMSHISSSDPDNHLPEHLYKESSIKLNLKTTERDLHEIQVPTCSYRMGVPNMGYGVMQLYRDGTMEYRVLWLPSRFKQLFLYLVIYFLVKIIVAPWALWKVCTYVCRKVAEHRLIERTIGYSRVV